MSTGKAIKPSTPYYQRSGDEPARLKARVVVAFYLDPDLIGKKYSTSTIDRWALEIAEGMDFELLTEYRDAVRDAEGTSHKLFSLSAARESIRMIVRSLDVKAREGNLDPRVTLPLVRELENAMTSRAALIPDYDRNDQTSSNAQTTGRASRDNTPTK